MAGSTDVYRAPGELLGLTSEYDGGLGTYTRRQKIHASLLGVQRISPSAPGKKPVVEVVHAKSKAATPFPGAIVTGKVAKVTEKIMVAEILCVGRSAVPEKFRGIVRQVDVRPTAVDQVNMFDCFRPGDLIRAEVLSLGDARAYFLTTAKNELGVLHAKSLAGAPMVAINWQEMQCPITKRKEPRKVAKLSGVP
eukprot:TRINITY_DN23143_c0_g1_i1.p2 TRINITY_DN23143_c0_g1~~TRINITY_DN23143_c0_g1_i1.p2  ORF type:complete len:194 (-),score=29.64 TRINITY_DN23143_c0_g1_i1:888-1469(-)